MDTRRDFTAGLWRLADPKVSLASFASLLLGGCAAAAIAPFHTGWFALTLAGIFALEVAKNASGEVFDFDTGVDQAVTDAERSPFSGGKRVLVDGLLSRADTWKIALAGYALAIAAGLAIAMWRAPQVLWLGLAGVALAWFYHAPPLRLAYRGLGEFAVGIAYGPLIALGTFHVQTGGWEATLGAQSVSLGLLVAAFLVANEIPDFTADHKGGKRNLVARLGRAGGARLFAMITATAWLLLGCTVLLSGKAWTPWAFAGLPASAWATLRLQRAANDIPRVIPAQAAALLAFVLFAVGGGCGWILVGTGVD